MYSICRCIFFIVYNLIPNAKLVLKSMLLERSNKYLSDFTSCFWKVISSLFSATSRHVFISKWLIERKTYVYIYCIQCVHKCKVLFTAYEVWRTMDDIWRTWIQRTKYMLSSYDVHRTTHLTTYLCTTYNKKDLLSENWKPPFLTLQRRGSVIPILLQFWNPWLNHVPWEIKLYPM
jgi:hypothetical protein